MDIRERLSRTIDPNDPQFETLLKIAIQTELVEVEEELRVKRNRNHRKKDELASVLERRKYLKKSIEEKTELVQSMSRAMCCLQNYSILMLKKVESVKKMLDEDSLRNLRIIEETEKLRDNYQKMWKEYEEQFESLPLAKERKLAKDELKRVEVQLGFIKMNIQEMKRNVRDYDKFKELKLQRDIIKIAHIWINHRNNVNSLKKLRQEDAELKAKIAEQKIKIKALIKDKEEEERQKALARFQMPPPIMNHSFMETIMSQYSQLTPKVGQKLHSQLYPPTDKYNDNDFDSSSVSSSLFEMCINEKQSFENEQRIEQVHNDPDNVSLSSTRDGEFATENRQCNITMNSMEDSLEEVIKSITKNAGGSSQNPICNVHTEKPTLERSETSKRPANSPEESKIRKKLHDDQSKANINPSEKSPQDTIALELKTMKTIQKSVLKQSRGPETERREEATSAVLERKEIAVVNSLMGNSNLEGSFSPRTNYSFAGSADSFTLNENNNNEQGTTFDMNSDLSLQSHLDDPNESLNFSGDEISNKVKSDNNLHDSNTVNPDQPAQAQLGMFAVQNNRFFNFQGFFRK